MIDIIKIALQEYATREIPGINSNKRILQYFREVGRPEWKSDEIHWCAVFVNWCLVQIGSPVCGTGLAESFLKYGTQTNRPELGDIVVFFAGQNSGKINHVGFFIKIVDKSIYVLGGNQNDEVNIVALPVKEVTAFRKIPKGIAPDDPRHKYNTATGEPNPKYNPYA